MLTLMLALTMILLALAVVVPDLRQQVQRDREEELRHRGSAYMRAIQHFYKKFSRYPTRVEELENTNNLRFLRKRYTDPINIDPATHKERDFRFLHQQDISLNNGPVLPGQSTPAGQMGGGGQGIFGGAPTGPLGQSGFGGTQPGGFGGPQGGPGGFGAQPGGQQPTDSGNPSSGNSSSANSSDAGGNPNSNGSSSSNSNSSSGPNGQTFGGGPILGVASASKEKTIRVFFDKNHYNDWLFIYMPMADRGGLLTGPINPGMQTGNMGGLTPGQTAGGAPGQGGLGQSGFGQGGFGQSLGQGGSPLGGQNQGLQPQAPQTPAPTPQQQ
jgi:type II secretory pathway pseudopilin PulG